MLKVLSASEFTFHESHLEMSLNSVVFIHASRVAQGTVMSVSWSVTLVRTELNYRMDCHKV